MGGGGKSKVEVKKGPWTRDEDQKLLSYIQQHGHGSWRTLPEKAGLERCGKSCRLRWTNYLRPDIKRGKFSSHEEKSIIRLHALLGNRWSAIAAHLPNRTDNEIKNYWNTRLKKRLTRMGIDPTTHKPKNNQAGSKHSATVNHMAQWESARLEAEARLARASNLSLLQRATAAPPPPPPCLDVLKVWEATALPVGFFGSAESPTSTLLHGFSSPAAVTAPTVLSCSVKESDVMSENNNVGGREVLDWYSEMVNSLPLDESDGNMVYSVDYDFDAVGSMDRLASNYDDYSATVGPSEDGNNDNNHWNDLFHLVSSTM